MWIARDKDGSLWIYEEKPIRCEDEWRCADDETSFNSEIEKMDSNSRIFSKVTWESSPQELIIKD